MISSRRSHGNTSPLHLRASQSFSLSSKKPRPKANTVIGTVTPNQNDMKGFQTPLTKQIPGMSFSEIDIQKMVLDVFMEPASLMREQGLHIDDVIRRLDLPPKRVKEAIAYHNDIGHIYSTIDDSHFKSAMNG